MNLACILIRHFPFYAETLRYPNLRREPVIIARIQGSKRIVVDHSPSLSSVQQGMRLQTASSLIRHTAIIEADDAYYKTQFNEILKDLTAQGLTIESANFECIYIDIKDLKEYCVSNRTLMMGPQGSIPYGLHPRFGIGKGKFIAYLAALSAKPHRIFAPPEDLFRFLKGFSVDTLPVSPAIKVRLHRFGLHTLNNIADLHINALQTQFGHEGKLIWEFANGIDNRPLIPYQIEEIITEYLSFTDPITTLAPILSSIELLLEKTFSQLKIRQRYPRSIDLHGEIYKKPIWIKHFTFKSPVQNPHQALERIKAVLDGAVLPGPMENLSLVLKNMTRQAGYQTNLFRNTDVNGQMREVFRQLDTVLGKETPIYQIAEVEPWSRIPERRYILLPVVR